MAHRSDATTLPRTETLMDQQLEAMEKFGAK
jgi:hypothetical protein